MAKRSNQKFDRNNPRLPGKKSQEVDQKYVDEHPGYKPGVWMRNPSSLSKMSNEDERSKSEEDRIINEEIDRYINDYSRETKESKQYLKDKIDRDLRNRQKMLDELKKRDAQGRDSPRQTDVEEEKRKIENMYQRMMEDDLQKQKQMQRERDKMNDLIQRRIKEQDRLLELQRKEVEERNKRLLDEERLKNEIEKNRLRDLKKQREELLKQELKELSQIEKHEKKKRMIEEELRRSIKEREAEKERLNDLNKKIEELRQREIEELSRIKGTERDISRRRKELLDDAYPNRTAGDDVIDVWPCPNADTSNMCVVDPRNLCIDPFSGKLVIRGDLLPPREDKRADKRSDEITSSSTSTKLSNASAEKHGSKTLTKKKYLELLSTYDPKKLRRKLSFQNWLINDSGYEDKLVAKKFPGSDFSLKIDMDEWPAIKKESMKRYAALKNNRSNGAM